MASNREAITDKVFDNDGRLITYAAVVSQRVAGATQVEAKPAMNADLDQEEIELDDNGFPVSWMGAHHINR